MTSERPDHYAVLGVPPDATQAQISNAYRALVRRHHPDTRDTADQSQRTASDTTLRQVLAAYAVLRDPARRANYDQQAEPPTPPAGRTGLRPRHADPRDQPPIVAGPVHWTPP